MSIVGTARRQGAGRLTMHGWWYRFQAEGTGGLRERSSRRHRSTRRLVLAWEAKIAALRLATVVAPGMTLGRPTSIVSKVLSRLRLTRPARGPVLHYERERAGELLHIDIKHLSRFYELDKAVLAGERRTLSRGAGWQCLHVTVDDHPRLAYAEVLPSERIELAVAFLHRAIRW